jgi:hypothetical protein
MAPTSIDALGNGSSLAHLLQRLFREKPFYAPGARSGLKILGVFFVLALLFMALASIGIAVSEDSGIGTVARHATAWYWALSFLALLSIIVIQFSLMKSCGALKVSSTKEIVHLRDGVTSAVLPRPPTAR